MNFDYFYGLESEQFSFIMMPMFMITDPEYRKMSSNAKIVYSLLLNRMHLSRKNGWLDEDNRVFIIYKRALLARDAGLSEELVSKATKQLIDKGLIEKRKRGLSMPDIIYVKNFLPDNKREIRPTNEDEMDEDDGLMNDDATIENVQNPISREVENPTSESNAKPKPIRIYSSQTVKNQDNTGYETAENGEDCQDLAHRTDNPISRGSENPISGHVEIRSQEDGKSGPINNINYKNTNSSNTDSNHILSADEMDDEMRAYTEIIKENISYDSLLHDYPYDKKFIDEFLDVMVETVTSKREKIFVAQDWRSANYVKSKILKLDNGHMQYIIDSYKKNYTGVSSPRQYMLTTLFNASSTIDSYYTALVNYDMAHPESYENVRKTDN